jgi:hypothetical protein
MKTENPHYPHLHIVERMRTKKQIEENQRYNDWQAGYEAGQRDKEKELKPNKIHY